MTCVSAAAIALLELPGPNTDPGLASRTQYTRAMADAQTCKLRYGEATFARNLDGRLVCIPRRGPAFLQKEED